MILLNNIHPLTDFKRNTPKFRARLKKSGQPEVLTVEGRPDLVVQDAASYQKMLEVFNTIAVERVIQDRLSSVKSGKPGVGAKEVLRSVRRRLQKKQDDAS